MYLIIGGAYQGKLEFIKNDLGIGEKDIFFCDGASVDFSFRCIYGIEKNVLALIKEGCDPVAFWRENIGECQESIIAAREFFSGLTPIDESDRRWAKATAEVLSLIASKADRVSRIYLGLEQRLK